MRSLSHEEASRLAEVVSGTRDEALILLALRTGMRQGELAALRWEDLELDGPRPTITIQHSADTRKQTRVSTTKTGEERRVRIGPRMVDVLTAVLIRVDLEADSQRGRTNPPHLLP